MIREYLRRFQNRTHMFLNLQSTEKNMSFFVTSNPPENASLDNWALSRAVQFFVKESRCFNSIYDRYQETCEQ